jgi:hypothetical protein
MISWPFRNALFCQQNETVLKTSIAVGAQHVRREVDHRSDGG